jgi:hypothetical protein
MASPFKAFLAGMGTVVAALGLGFSTVLMFMPSVSQKEPPPQRRAEPAPVELRFVVADPPAVKSQLITATQTPMISSSYAAPPPLWAPAARSTTGQSSREPELARDPGVRQIPARPALSTEAAAAVASAQPDIAHNPDAVSAEPKKKKKIVQRKPRNQFAEQQGYASSYAPERRNQAPLGFLGLFLGDSGRGR